MTAAHPTIGGIFKDIVCGTVGGDGFARSWLNSTLGKAQENPTLTDLWGATGLNYLYHLPLNLSQSPRPPKVTDPVKLIPSFMPGATPCPPTEGGAKAAFDRASKIDEFLYHKGNHLFKQEHNAHHWGSECAYDRTTGQLIPPGAPGAGTADYWPDGTYGHLVLDPGGPRLLRSAYDQYWRANPHPPGMVRRN